MAKKKQKKNTTTKIRGTGVEYSETKNYRYKGGGG